MDANYHSLSERPWINPLTPLSRGLPNSEMEMMMVPTSQSDEISEITMSLKHSACCWSQIVLLR